MSLSTTSPTPSRGIDEASGDLLFQPLKMGAYTAPLSFQWKLKGAVLAGSPILLGVEVTTFETDLAGGGDNDADQVIFSGIYTF